MIDPGGNLGIKRYTTPVGASMGFGLVYVVGNIGMAIAGWLMDKFRDVFGETAGTTLPVFGHMSTYQLLALLALGLTFVSIVINAFMRDGVEMGPKGVTVTPSKKKEGSLGQIILTTIKESYREIGSMLASVAREKFFWKFLFIIGLTVFARFIFFHNLYTAPKYMIRVLGEGAKIGNLIGILNPVMIVFLVPFVAAFTKKASSYWMMIVGTIISSSAVFIAAIPGSFFDALTNTVLGEIVFVKWFGLAPNMEALAANPPSAVYWSLIFYVVVLSLGEALWSPRLIQFTAEIAPRGKEGTYIALSILPWFLAKFAVGPMSGLLLKFYAPLNEVVDAAGKTVQVVGDLSNHYMVWIWIGGCALITPIGLILFKKIFNSMTKEREQMEAQEEAEIAAAQA